jgi:hypothetical protein
MLHRCTNYKKLLTHHRNRSVSISERIIALDGECSWLSALRLNSVRIIGTTGFFKEELPNRIKANRNKGVCFAQTIVSVRRWGNGRYQSRP